MNKGIFLAGLALASSSLWAADWNFYGSVRLSTFGEALLDTGDADTEFSNYYRMQPNSRLGANVKDGAITATFEAGIGPVAKASGGSTDALVLRRLFASWQVNPDLAVLAGQEYTLIHYTANNQVWGNDNNLGKQGAIDEAREPQLRISAYGAQLALISGKQSPIEVRDGLSYEARPSNIPKVELNYSHAMGPLNLGAALGYNRYRLDAVGSRGLYDAAYTLQNFVGVLDLGFKNSALSAHASAGFALNGAEYGLAISSPFKAYLDNSGEVVSSTSWMGFANMQVPIGAYVAPEAGVGLERHGQEFGHEDASLTRLSAYVQTSIYPVKNVTLVPEVGIRLESGTDKQGEDFDNPTLLYYGAKSQINF